MKGLLGLGDDSQAFSAIASGPGDLGLSDAIGERCSDQGEELGAGGVGAGLLLLEGGCSLAEFSEVIHERQPSTLANSVDKSAVLANTIGMPTPTAYDLLMQEMTTNPDLVESVAVVVAIDDDHPDFEHIS